MFALKSMEDTGSNELIEVYLDPPEKKEQTNRKRDYSFLDGESQELEVEQSSLSEDLEINETPQVNENSPEDIKMNDYSEDVIF